MDEIYGHGYHVVNLVNEKPPDSAPRPTINGKRPFSGLDLAPPGRI